MDMLQQINRQSRNGRFLAIGAVIALIMILAVSCQYIAVQAFANIPSVTLTITSSNGRSVILNQTVVGNLSSYTAWGGTINKVGSIKNRGIYTGVPISTLCNLVGGIQKGQTLRVTGGDGYKQNFTYSQVSGNFPTYNNVTGAKATPTKSLTTILAYYFQGQNLTYSYGSSLRFAVVGPEGLLTNSSYWVSYVVKLEILGTVPAVTISPSSATIDLGQSETLTSSVSNGTLPYYYQWYLNGTTTGVTASSYTFIPSSRGLYDFYLNVTDKNNATALSNTATVLVNNGPAVTISPSSATIDLGQSETLTSSVSNGTLPYYYQWYLNGVANGTSSSWTLTPALSGSYSIYLNITDSARVPLVVRSNTVSLIVNAAPYVAISPTSWTLDVGQSKTFMATASMGTGILHYQWYVNGATVGGDSSTYSFAAVSVGSYSISVNVTDSASFPVTVKSNNAGVTVNPLPSVGGYSSPITSTTTLLTCFLTVTSFLTFGLAAIRPRTRTKAKQKKE